MATIWKLTIEQTTERSFEGRYFDSTEKIVLKAENVDKLCMTVSAFAEGWPNDRITYKIEREVEE